jgi:uncharacterized RDD family membrane protein YckC
VAAQPFPTPAGSLSAFGEYAQWPLRVQSALMDWAGPFIAAGLVGFILPGSGLDFVGYLVALGWALYNAYLGGQTGQSYGKKWAGTRLLREADGQLIGGGMGIARYLLHIIDSLPCYLGYFWPIWDDKRQTFSDKILNTLVVKV